MILGLKNLAAKDARWQSFYRRYAGKTDEYGFDLQSFRRWEPFFRFLYEGYFGVEMIGVENIPAEGKVVLVGNHSGGLPFDAMMLLSGYYNQSARPRRMRALAHIWLRRKSFISKLICSLGAVPATFDTAVKLLKNDELVIFYPEGTRGTGKLYRERYRLYDFDPGFVKAAILTGAPIVPVVTIGGDELYPVFTNILRLARFLGMPYFPITPLFPFAPFTSSCLPLPSRMLIKIGKPIVLDYPPEAASNRKLRLKIAREIQYAIQSEVNFLLDKRISVFSGWDPADIAGWKVNS